MAIACPRSSFHGRPAATFVAMQLRRSCPHPATHAAADHPAHQHLRRQALRVGCADDPAGHPARRRADECALRHPRVPRLPRYHVGDDLLCRTDAEAAQHPGQHRGYPQRTGAQSHHARHRAAYRADDGVLGDPFVPRVPLDQVGGRLLDRAYAEATQHAREGKSKTQSYTAW
jgi:hypothetical protein